MKLGRLFTSAACVAGIVVGCTINNTTPASNGQGTSPVNPSQAQALITGQVDSSVGQNVQFRLNGQIRTTVLAPDQSFVVRDVPSGTVTLECDADDVQGTLTIDNVQPGEIIEVTITRQGDSIVIVITRRTTSSQQPQQVDNQGGDALEITASHVCYWFKPGHYTRDIIVTGDDVHLFGAAHDSCVIDDFTILDGKLELDGKNITVLDVDLTGPLVIKDRSDKVQDTCTKCFDEGCEHACGDEDHGGHACGKDAGTSNDAGGGTTDAGAPMDAAPMPDAAPPVDAGPAPDAGPVDAGVLDAGPMDAATGG